MDAALQEITEAMDEMGERWGVRRFLVGGICLGAELAFRAAQTDDRIAGIPSSDAERRPSNRNGRRVSRTPVTVAIGVRPVT